jgi:phosphopantothenoylcysteine synthetase/decarboxylase
VELRAKILRRNQGTPSLKLGIAHLRHLDKDEDNDDTKTEWAGFDGEDNEDDNDEEAGGEEEDEEDEEDDDDEDDLKVVAPPVTAPGKAAPPVQKRG